MHCSVCACACACVRAYVHAYIYVCVCSCVYFSNHILSPSIHSVWKISYEGCTYREGDVVVFGKEDDSSILGQGRQMFTFSHSPASRILQPLSLL